MSNRGINCPFCATFVPTGATVCRGCGAEERLSKSKTKTYSTGEACGLGIVVWLISSVIIYSVTLFSIDFSTAMFIAAVPAIAYGMFMDGYSEQQNQYKWYR